MANDIECPRQGGAETLHSIRRKRVLSSLVFTTPEGQSLHNNFKRYWNLARSKHKLEDFCFHDLRHTFVPGSCGTASAASRAARWRMAHREHDGPLRAPGPDDDPSCGGTVDGSSNALCRGERTDTGMDTIVQIRARHGNCERRASAYSEGGAPGRRRTCDPRIRRRGPVMSRPSVFLVSSAQPRAAARVLFARLADSVGLSAHSRTEIGVSEGCVQRKSAQARHACARKSVEPPQRAGRLSVGAPRHHRRPSRRVRRE